MYSILIVDDEPVVRKGLKVRLAELGFEFSRIYEASGGHEGLEIIQEKKPEIVLTDISMPDVNGLQMIESAINSSSKARFILISGYSEFEYARKAVELGAVSYLLKPVSDEQLSEIMNKVIFELDKSRQIVKQLEESEKREKYQHDLEEETRINQALADTSGQLFLWPEEQGKKYLLGAVRLTGSEESASLSGFSNQFSQKVQKLDPSISVSVCRNVFNSREYFLVLCAADAALNEIRPRLPALLSDLLRKRDLSFHAGIGTISVSLGHEQYLTTMQALLQCRVFHSRETQLSSANTEKNADIWADDIIKLYSQCLVRGKQEECIHALNELIRSADPEKVTLQNLNDIIRRVISLTRENLYEQGKVIPSELKDSYMPSVDSFHDLKEVADFLTQRISIIFDKDETAPDNCTDIVEHIKARIDADYQEDLSVAELAAPYSVSANYLSSLFTQKYGYTLNRYITKVRMDKACQLLSSTNLSIAQIAGMVGYNDPQYFYRVFKKVNNMTPFDYRTQNSTDSQQS